MDILYKYVLYVNGKVVGKLHKDCVLKENEKVVSQGVCYVVKQMLGLVAISSKQFFVPCIVEPIGLVKYKWIANTDDGAFKDESDKLFNTKEECYNDMRNAVLEKMKWNTEFSEDFDEGTTINYAVSFSQDAIAHSSYSGLYTYRIVECTPKI